MMKRIWLVLAALCAGLACAGCGDKAPADKGATGAAAPAAAPSEEDAVRARLSELLALAEKGDAAAAAGYVVYRDPDETRKWKDVCDYAREGDRMPVDSVLRQIGEVLKSGPLAPQGFQRDTESEGEWLILTYTAGERRVAFAFLAIKGTYALGDID
jgi:hypothetical protein